MELPNQVNEPGTHRRFGPEAWQPLHESPGMTVIQAAHVFVRDIRFFVHDERRVGVLVLPVDPVEEVEVSAAASFGAIAQYRVQGSDFLRGGTSILPCTVLTNSSTSPPADTRATTGRTKAPANEKKVPVNARMIVNGRVQVPTHAWR